MHLVAAKIDIWSRSSLIIAMGIMTLLSVLSTCVLTSRHMAGAKMRGEYVYIARILWMVPMYSIQAWVMLYCRLSAWAELLEFIRKAYECITIFAFTQMMVFQLGGLRDAVHHLDEDHCQLLPPVSWLVDKNSWKPKQRFVKRTLSLVLIYVPCTLIPAVFVFLAASLKFGMKPTQQFSSVLINITQFVAMYGLVTFYHANQDQLRSIQPVKKLLSIKVLLFFTNMQTFAIHGLAHFGFLEVFSISAGMSVTGCADMLINSLICIEMFLLAICHHCIYPSGELDPGRVSQNVVAQMECQTHQCHSLKRAFTLAKQKTRPLEEELLRRDAWLSPQGAQHCRFCTRVLTAANLFDIAIFYIALTHINVPQEDVEASLHSHSDSKIQPLHVSKPLDSTDGD